MDNVIFYVYLGCLIIVRCFGDITLKSSKTTLSAILVLYSSVSIAGEWYQGGTLHKATAKEWQSASIENRLATSADFIASTKAATSMGQLKTRAVALQQCVTDATKGVKLQSLNVTDSAAACIILLGYK